LTARALGIDEKLAITDAALLVTDYYEASTNSETGMAYMPHWNMHSIELQTICRDLGIRYVDPTNPDIITTLDEIACSTTLITEAMHGAILADSYGVPWIPVKTTPEILDMKWHDWCATVDIDYAPNRVTPIWDMPQDKSHIRKAKQAIKRIMIKHELQSLVKHGSRMLSSPVVRNNNMRRLKSALELLTTDLRSGYS
jgi:succinoglycan biosynthesis protein ExoV